MIKFLIQHVAILENLRSANTICLPEVIEKMRKINKNNHDNASSHSNRDPLPGY